VCSGFFLEEGKDGENEKYNEADLGDQGRCARKAAEAEDTRDDGDDEKNDGVVKHGELGVRSWGSLDGIICRMQDEGKRIIWH
jgi:hypothetical protein